MHYTVFSRGEYNLYYALRRISGGRYYIYYALRSIFGGRILFILLRTTQFFRGADTIYTMQYVVFSGGGYYLYYALRRIFGEQVLFIRPYLRSSWDGEGVRSCRAAALPSQYSISIMIEHNLLPELVPYRVKNAHHNSGSLPNAAQDLLCSLRGN